MPENEIQDQIELFQVEELTERSIQTNDVLWTFQEVVFLACIASVRSVVALLTPQPKVMRG